MNTAMIFLVSACFCALISNIFWNKGVLDYIYLKPLFIFDLKDIYVNIGILLFLLYSIKNKEQMKNINLNPKDVIAYITKRFNPMN
jgi:lipoprotein signal peptidase